MLEVEAEFCPCDDMGKADRGGEGLARAGWPGVADEPDGGKRSQSAKRTVPLNLGAGPYSALSNPKM